MTAATPGAQLPAPLRPLASPAPTPDLHDGVVAYLVRLRAGDTGSAPAVLGLVALVVLFAVLRPDVFPTPANTVHLLVQASSISVLAMGLVFVLLLGEIDLSAGVVGGTSAGVMAVLLLDGAWPWWTAVAAALVTGAAVGALLGLLVARWGIPSFAATLALFTSLQGVTQLLVGDGRSIAVRDPVLVGLTSANAPVAAGWALALLGVGAHAVLVLLGWRTQRRRGLVREGLGLVVARVVGVAVLVLGLTAWLSRERGEPGVASVAGVPWVVPVVAVLALSLGFVLRRTRYGRHLYAVGGHREAARRVGVPVLAVRVTAFVVCSTTAALAGVIDASRLTSVGPGSGATTLLYAVGAAVIGGTSLFGGHGRIGNAVVGGLMVATISNGLGLLGQGASVNAVVTGGVLLLAATVDALARRRRRAAAAH